MHQDTISATGIVKLGGSANSLVSTLLLRGKDGGSWNGSLVLQGKVIGGALDAVPIMYKRRAIAGAVSDDTSVSTAITDTDFLIEANISGLEVELDATVVAGELDIEWLILHG